jgi:acyl-CoA thioester hydrolase
MMPEYQFTLPFEVRDYECDMQGIVNNAVYQHYLEHARHVHIRQLGIDFAALARQGINLVVVRVELDYLHPLRSGDHFSVGINVERVSRLRFGFRQDIVRLGDARMIARANVITTAVNEHGRPFLPQSVAELLLGRG